MWLDGGKGLALGDCVDQFPVMNVPRLSRSEARSLAWVMLLLVFVLLVCKLAGA
jgi:hypothetical protein